MRLAVGLLIFSLIGIAFCSLQLLRKPESQNLASLIPEITASFQKSEAPSLVLDFAKIPQGRELIDPSTHLPQSHRYPYKEISQLYLYANSCSKVAPAVSTGLQKALEWHISQCKQLPLRENFFRQAPFIHPSGKSYVSLAKNKDFAHAHIQELTSLGAEISENQRLLLSLASPEVSQLLAGAAIVLSTSNIFFQKENRGINIPENIYAGYSIENWNRFIAKYPVRFEIASNSCFLAEGNGCWVPATADRSSLFQWALFAFLPLSVLSVSSLAIGAVIRKRRDHKRKLFILQTLTHELRTPAATLKLCLEGMRRDFDTFGEEAQTSFLRMCDEVQRLQRLVEGSSQYLHSQVGDKLLELKPTLILSVNEFVMQIIDPWRENLTVKLLEKDRSIKSDPYWLALCLKNLVDNALSHGKPPVTVELEAKGNLVAIHISDGGTFNLNSEKKGLGFGLPIVKTVTTLLGGELQFRTNPTIFSLSLQVPS